MLILLSLTACLDMPEPLDDGTEVRPDEEPAGLHIATAPMKGERARAPIVESPLPDGEAIVTGAGDETLRFWNVFSKARSQKVVAV